MKKKEIYDIKQPISPKINSLAILMRIYKCELCEKHFNQKSHLLAHANRKFKCVNPDYETYTIRDFVKLPATPIKINPIKDVVKLPANPMKTNKTRKNPIKNLIKLEN